MPDVVGEEIFSFAEMHKFLMLTCLYFGLQPKFQMLKSIAEMCQRTCNISLAQFFSLHRKYYIGENQSYSFAIHFVIAS